MRLRRRVKGEINGVDDDRLALWARGIKQAGITNFFQPARVGLEENRKELRGTPGGGPTSQTPMGLGLGLPLASQASGPPGPHRKIYQEAAGHRIGGRDGLDLDGVKMEREPGAHTQRNVALKGGKDKEGLGWAQKAVVLSTGIFR